MIAQVQQLPAGLYLVATPIGAARDITLRALDVLASAEVLAAEDTRTLRRLMEIHGVPLAGRRILAYHDHNGPAARPGLLRALAEGRSVAYASEAGTPLVADPGYALVREAVAAGHNVTTAPGPSAAVAALSIAGLPTDRYLFVGFPPVRRAERAAWLETLVAVPATLVIYETAKRVNRTLDEMVQSWGGERKIAVCRELTKRFEEVLRGALRDVAEMLSGRALKGEIVLVIDRDRRPVAAGDMEAELREALAEMSVRDAADHVADALGLPRRQVYQAALKLRGSG